MSCCQAAMFQGIVERMTKELTALGSTHDEDQDGGCSAREKALGIDWRIDLVFPQHFAAGVDLEGRVRWILPDHRPFSSHVSLAKKPAEVHDTSFRVDIHKNLYANVAPSGGTTVPRDCGAHEEGIDDLRTPRRKTSSLSAMNVFTARKCCSSQVSLVKKPVTPLSKTSRSATLMSARICSP